MLGLANEDGPGRNDFSITTRDLTTYVAGGELAPEVRAEIKRQVAIVGSPVQRWVVDSDAKMQYPFAVDWGESAQELEREIDDGEAQDDRTGESNWTP
jgi:hypothetical protein